MTVKKTVRGTLGWLKESQLDWFPLRHHLKGYSLTKGSGDLTAGVNVALLAFPQGMAYALIAGLPIEYGIYGGAVAAIIASFLSGGRFITLGPTNATAVTIGSAFAGLGVMLPAERAGDLPLLLAMVGLFLVVGAYLRAAGIIQYISRTVITGYITAASLLIIVGQIKNVLGVELTEAEKQTSTTFFEKVFNLSKHLLETEWFSVLIAGITFVLFYSIQRVQKSLNRRRKARASEESRLVADINIPNVAITLVMMSVVTAILSQSLGQSISLLDSVDARNWPVGIPEISFEKVAQLSNLALPIALLCVLEGMSIGKTLAARSGERLNVNQEMLSIGASNFGCGLFGGMPASGSLTRSQLSWSSGGQTPLASLFNGVIVAVAVFMVGPYLNYVPMPVLAALVITIGISLFNVENLRVAFNSTTEDRAVLAVTLGVGLLFPLTTAITWGAALSIILFLRKAASPELVEYGFTDEGQLAELDEKSPAAEVSIVHVEGDLFFGAAEIFNDQMRRVCGQDNLRIVVLKMRNARHLDATSVMAIKELVQYMNERDRTLIMSEVKPDVRRVLENSRVMQVINEKNLFDDDPQNPTLSTARAMRRAQELLGDTEAEIKIYVNPERRKKVGEN